MKQNFTVRQGALDGVETFLSVAQHRSFRRAAADLGVTPSAISQAVRALEARVGAALFTRTTRSALGWCSYSSPNTALACGASPLRWNGFTTAIEPKWAPSAMSSEKIVVQPASAAEASSTL
jgi:hypothetical protein